MKIVVGLGNVGSRYAGNRHNLGFLVADQLSRDLHCSPIEAAGVPASLLEGRVATPQGEESLVVVKPTTLMNGSGRALSALARTGAEFSPADLLVVLDDIYLSFGRLRLRGSGSAGGHNGLKSVLESLGTTAVPRLRCGVGPVPEGADLVDYVLEDFSTPERKALPEFVDRAAIAARTCLEQGLPAAMNRFNVVEGVE